VSFWVNFLVVTVAAIILGEQLRDALDDAGWPGLSLASAQFCLFWILVFPWQLMGVLRAGERAAAGYQHRVAARLAPLCVLGTLAGLPSQLIGLGSDLHTLMHPKPVLIPAWQRERTYVLSLSPDATRLRIDGFFDFGVTRDVRALVEANPTVTRPACLPTSPDGIP
jgi:hypothetical protein